MRVVVLSSGSKGNSTYVETSNHKILIDIGTSSLYVEKSLRKIGVDPNEIDIILITHSHVDHTNGLRVFIKKFNPSIYISRKTLSELKISMPEDRIIDDLNILGKNIIKEITLSHDVSDIKGYIIEEDNSSMVYITDTGYINERYFKKISNKNLYVFESNHDVEMLMNNDSYPHNTKIRILSDKGHLSNKDSSYYLTKLIGSDTKYIILAHLSEKNNTEDLALSTLKSTLTSKKIKFENVSVARQNEMTEIFTI